MENEVKVPIIKKLRDKIFRIQLFLVSDPFKVAALWKKRGIHVGENTCIYHDVVISGGGNDPVYIGSNCVLTGCTLLAHDASTNCLLGIKYGEPSPSEPIIIEDDCFIGYSSIILMGVKIGKGSVVGAGAVVTKEVPAGSVVIGNPARVICTVDELVQKRQKYRRK
jgi:acetyltransferase-like isoleucine patch superfamily enzyme